MLQHLTVARPCDGRCTFFIDYDVLTHTALEDYLS